MPVSDQPRIAQPQPHPAADDRSPAAALTALRLAAAQRPQWTHLPVTPARARLALSGGAIDVAAARRLWSAGRNSRFEEAPIRVDGDPAPGADRTLCRALLMAGGD